MSLRPGCVVKTICGQLLLNKSGLVRTKAGNFNLKSLNRCFSNNYQVRTWSVFAKMVTYTSWLVCNSPIVLAPTPSSLVVIFLISDLLRIGSAVLSVGNSSQCLWKMSHYHLTDLTPRNSVSGSVVFCTFTALV